MTKHFSHSFRERVLAIVSKIRRGHVCTYADVARQAGSPNAYRAVGNILHKNYDSRIPCHRVIRTDGRVGGFNRGTRKKRSLLRDEGASVALTERKR